MSACGGGSSSKESSSEKATKEDSASIKATKEDSASIAAKGGKITCEEYISLDYDAQLDVWIQIAVDLYKKSSGQEITPEQRQMIKDEAKKQGMQEVEILAQECRKSENRSKTFNELGNLDNLSMNPETGQVE
ncbi:hypothetical protein R6G85_05745 [Actinotignum urinale]|uniref:Lipoprotein n=1 Tax=Actinotignum urinale TaxID=190146 RepID=A0ABU5G4B1_9ACTO|nr:hypothetical protein [Actinotignum urinale]MDY5132210.1 hypothetical protein [Actinotignum urinale]MDY5151980.1 hypothetical protein [Actinotignum urinale]